MNNNLTALNNLLFEQIERINDDDLTGEELSTAIDKAETINKLASTIVSTGNLQLKAYQEFGLKAASGMSTMLGIEE